MVTIKYPFTYKIGRNSPCPCASGKKFKHCCSPHLEAGLREKASELYEAGKFAEAETAYRAWLTQYKIWHEEHTVPFHRDEPEKADGLLVVDIEAVISILYSLSECLYRQKKTDQIDPLLKGTESLIDDVRYLFCIYSLRAYNFGIRGDFKSVKKVLKACHKPIYKDLVTFEFGLHYLRIYLDVLWTDMPLSECLSLTDLILDADTCAINEVEDLVRESTILFVYKDSISASQFAKKAIEKSKIVKTENSMDQQRLHLALGRALKIDYVITNIQEIAFKSIGEYKALLSSVSEKKILADINQDIGQVYDYLGDDETAKKYLQTAYNLNPTMEIKLDLARIHAIQGSCEKALEILSQIKLQQLEDNYKIDYYTSLAQIAIEKGDYALAGETEQNLAKLKTNLPVITDIKNEIRFALLNFIANRKEKEPFLYKTRKTINRIFLLQPNFFGLGINVNKLIEPKEWKKFEKSEHL